MGPRRIPGQPPGFSDPLKDMLGPGRRRTDHPLVVGTIVLCVGVTALSGIATVAGVYSMKAAVESSYHYAVERDKTARNVRSDLARALETQRSTLLRVCINVARTKDDVNACYEEPRLSVPPSQKEKEK